MDARRHIDELQSLRGIAALVVVFSHVSGIFLPIGALRIAIDFVCNAHASVIVFFVLSGYVLTGSLLRRGLSWPSVRGFYLSRLFRLFPALWAASFISALFLLLLPRWTIHPVPNFWFLLYLHPFPSEKELALALMAIDRSLIMPVWTIFIELMGSAIMPLLVVLSLARRRLAIWVLIAMGIASYTLAHAPHRLNSLTYMFDFALGAWLASRKRGFFIGKSQFPLVAAAATLVFFRFAWFSIRAGHPMPLYGYDDPFPMLVEGIAAFFLIGELAAEHGRVRLLRSRYAIWLGNLSYSLYLIHFPVAILVTKILSHVFSNNTSAPTATALVLAAVLTISFGLSYLIYRFVEIPSIAFGKRILQKLSVDSVAVNVG